MKSRFLKNDLRFQTAIVTLLVPYLPYVYASRRVASVHARRAYQGVVAVIVLTAFSVYKKTILSVAWVRLLSRFLHYFAKKFKLCFIT